MQTISTSPKNFFYFNNGISALCESFDFDDKKHQLSVHKMQVVNGAQTLGAIMSAPNDKLQEVLVLVKLTAIKHSTRERGMSAELIKTTNTQNKLRAPDFRSNDPIQQWLEHEFKNTKQRNNLQHIAYGRKRPYPRNSSSQTVLKLQDLGKIRYAWLHDPRVPIADPAKLFELPEDYGLYGYAFGNEDGEVVDLWSNEQFQDCLLAIHTFNKLTSALTDLQEQQSDLKQIARLRWYALRLFNLYFQQERESIPVNELQQVYSFGGKYDDFFNKAFKLISRTIIQTYREILSKNEGTAFSLPRDSKVWEIVQSRFKDNLELVRDMRNG